MKKILVAIAFLLCSIAGISQKVNKITLADNGSSSIITFALDENVVVSISQNGNLVEWGVDRYAGRLDNIQRKLDEYTGRVEYYTENDNEAFRGKIKYIGKTLITYYASFDNQFFAGRIKAVGSQNIEYYNNFDETASQGKIKQIGQMPFSYYSSFDNEAYKGKIKSAGSVAITYYSAIEDKGFAGKIKSIGGNNFVYYSSQEAQVGLRGMLRTGRQVQIINGVTFWVKYN